LQRLGEQLQQELGERRRYEGEWRAISEELRNVRSQLEGQLAERLVEFNKIHEQLEQEKNARGQIEADSRKGIE